MKWIRVRSAEDERLCEVAESLKGGALAIIPTETVYGISGDSTNKEATRRIAEMKERPDEKSFILIAASKQMAQSIVMDWPEEAEKLAQAFWPGPLSLVLNAKEGGTMAIRIPGSAVARRICELAGAPLISTSANKAGGEPSKTAKAAVAQLGMACDWVVDVGELPGTPSTLVDVTGTSPVLLREGAVPWGEIAKVLRK